MGELYNKISALCDERGITGGRLCRDLGYYPSTLTDLKMGRAKSLSAEKLQRIAEYFGISVDELLGKEKQPPADVDEELWELRQVLHDRPELKVMFDLTKNATPAEVKKMLKVLQLMKEDETVD